MELCIIVLLNRTFLCVVEIVKFWSPQPLLKLTFPTRACVKQWGVPHPARFGAEIKIRLTISSKEMLQPGAD